MYGYWYNGEWCFRPETQSEADALALVFGSLRLERPPLRGRENIPHILASRPKQGIEGCGDDARVEGAGGPGEPIKWIPSRETQARIKTDVEAAIRKLKSLERWKDSGVDDQEFAEAVYAEATNQASK